MEGLKRSSFFTPLSHHQNSAKEGPTIPYYKDNACDGLFVKAKIVYLTQWFGRNVRLVNVYLPLKESVQGLEGERKESKMLISDILSNIDPLGSLVTNKT